MSEQIKPVVFVDPKELAAMKEHLPAKLHAKKTLGNFTITEPLYSAETIQLLQRENDRLRLVEKSHYFEVDRLRAEIAAAKQQLAQAENREISRLDYNELFNAISSSVKIQGDAISISVIAFRNAIDAARTAQAGESGNAN